LRRPQRGADFRSVRKLEGYNFRTFELSNLLTTKGCSHAYQKRWIVRTFYACVMDGIATAPNRKCEPARRPNRHPPPPKAGKHRSITFRPESRFQSAAAQLATNY